MMAAIADDTGGPDEIASLRATVDRYAADNRALAAKVEKLERAAGVAPDLRPLKSLVDASEYDRARWAQKSGALRSKRLAGRLYSTVEWVAAWRKLAGR